MRKKFRITLATTNHTGQKCETENSKKGWKAKQIIRKLCESYQKLLDAILRNAISKLFYAYNRAKTGPLLILYVVECVRTQQVTRSHTVPYVYCLTPLKISE